MYFQFVELKGSVFKKFDKNNLFQASCSDVRERFHLFVLLFIVVLQTMKEYSWKEGNCIFNFSDTMYCFSVNYQNFKSKNLSDINQNTHVLFVFRTILDTATGLHSRTSLRNVC